MSNEQTAVMISYQEAIEKILVNTHVLEPINLPIEQSAGRGLAEDLTAHFDQPVFDNAAVDGYGLKIQDVANASEKNPIALTVNSTIQAGTLPNIEIKSGEAVKLFAGAYVPPSVEAVVMQEYCSEENGSVKVYTKAKNGENIRSKGSEFKVGKAILPAGTLITPPVVGLLASCGYSFFFVGDRPKVALIITGDELMKPGSNLGPGKIFECNSYSLRAALSALGVHDVTIYHAKDVYGDLKNALSGALHKADIVICSGGISIGDHDFTKGVCAELSVEPIFWQVAINPGKPAYFGILPKGNKKNKLIFGLPGDPVSVLVTFDQFVKPAILKMMSIDVKTNIASAIFSGNITKQPGRLELVRAKLSSNKDAQLTVEPIHMRESHMLSSMAIANALIKFPENKTELQTGSIVEVSTLLWHI